MYSVAIRLRCSGVPGHGDLVWESEETTTMCHLQQGDSTTRRLRRCGDETVVDTRSRTEARCRPICCNQSPSNAKTFTRFRDLLRTTGRLPHYTLRRFINVLYGIFILIHHSVRKNQPNENKQRRKNLK